MKTITLTQGKVAIISDRDHKTMARLRWCASKNGSGEFYAVRMDEGRKVYLHRAILGVTDSRVHVDHMNHKTLDCRRRNLRRCSAALNGQNRRGPNSSNTSGARGVTWSKAANKWQAAITVNRKTVYLGLHTTVAAASKACRDERLQRFGDFMGNSR